MSKSWRAYLPFDLRRRFLRVLEAGTQLRLPAYLLLLTAGFGALFALNGYHAYGRIFEATLSMAAPAMEELIRQQSDNFLITSVSIGVGYLLTTLVLCVGYLHRVIGPTVPLRRQIHALLEGDYSARVQLRASDAAMAGMADDLNDLARALELGASKDD